LRLSWLKVVQAAVEVVAHAAGVETVIVIVIVVETETANGTATETDAEAEVALGHASAQDRSGLKISKLTMIWRCNYCYKRAKR
jgi:hypothetical protein